MGKSELYLPQMLVSLPQPLFEVAFVWELTKETIVLPLGCLQGGCAPTPRSCMPGAICTRRPARGRSCPGPHPTERMPRIARSPPITPLAFAQRLCSRLSGCEPSETT